MSQNTRGRLIMLLTSTTLKSLTKRTIGVERHWSHGTRQKPLGRTIIRARSLDNITFSLRNTNFLSIFNILSTTCFFNFRYIKTSFAFILYTFLSVEDSSSICRKLIVFLNFLPENDYTYFLFKNCSPKAR